MWFFLSLCLPLTKDRATMSGVWTIRTPKNRYWFTLQKIFRRNYTSGTNRRFTAEMTNGMCTMWLRSFFFFRSLCLHVKLPRHGANCIAFEICRFILTIKRDPYSVRSFALLNAQTKWNGFFFFSFLFFFFLNILLLFFRKTKRMNKNPPNWLQLMIFKSLRTFFPIYFLNKCI